MDALEARLLLLEGKEVSGKPYLTLTRRAISLTSDFWPECSRRTGTWIGSPTTNTSARESKDNAKIREPITAGVEAEGPGSNEGKYIRHTWGIRDSTSNTRQGPRTPDCHIFKQC